MVEIKISRISRLRFRFQMRRHRRQWKKALSKVAGEMYHAGGGRVFQPAMGAELDKLAETAGFWREPGESDQNLRKRIRAALREAQKAERVIFADGHCPECGEWCGNNGHGPLRCSCGWVGEELDSIGQSQEVAENE